MSVDSAANSKSVSFLPAGTRQLDPAHSSIEFQVKHLMIATVKGRFTEFEGTLEAGEDGTLTAVGTVQTASVDTHESQRDEHLRSADFFDAAAYPQIAFASTEIVPTGGSSFRLAGDLTIRGITKQVELSGSVQAPAATPGATTASGSSCAASSTARTSASAATGWRRTGVRHP